MSFQPIASRTRYRVERAASPACSRAGYWNQVHCNSSFSKALKHAFLRSVFGGGLECECLYACLVALPPNGDILVRSSLPHLSQPEAVNLFTSPRGTAHVCHPDYNIAPPKSAWVVAGLKVPTVSLPRGPTYLEDCEVWLGPTLVER